MANENENLLISLGRLERFKENLAPVAVSGSYNDLRDKPAIPVVPTDVSAFNNDAGYITAAESEALGFQVAFVDELPDIADAREKTVYFVPSSDPAAGNIKDEYMLADGAWELIGSTEIDLTGYLTENDLATDADVDALFEE